MREAASFIAGQSASSTAGALGTLAAAVTRLFRAWRSRRQLVTLQDFDAHMLADIGLTRRDVRDALLLPLGSDPARELHIRAGRNSRRGWNE